MLNTTSIFWYGKRQMCISIQCFEYFTRYTKDISKSKSRKEHCTDCRLCTKCGLKALHGSIKISKWFYIVYI